jgi:hypothetical protein
LQSYSRLGSCNAAIVAIYFAAVWGRDGLRILGSPFHGFEDPLQATAAAYWRALFDFNLDGLIRISNGLAALKFLIAAGFFAYLLEFLRATVTGKSVAQETLNCLLLAAVSSLMFWGWPALATWDAALIRVLATEFLLLSGVLIVIYIEHQLDPEVSAFVADIEPEPVPVVL